MGKIFYLMGKSSSGKDTIYKRIMQHEEIQLKKVVPYTTRPMRADDEANPTHTFVTQEEFDELDNRVGYTKFNGYEYCATAEQVDNNDIYVIDPAGVDFFKEKYHGIKTPIVVYIKATGDIRKDRMLARGDSVEQVIERLMNDIKAFKGAMKMADVIFEKDILFNADLEKQIFTIYSLKDNKTIIIYFLEKRLFKKYQ